MAGQLPPRFSGGSGYSWRALCKALACAHARSTHSRRTSSLLRARFEPVDCSMTVVGEIAITLAIGRGLKTREQDRLSCEPAAERADRLGSRSSMICCMRHLCGRRCVCERRAQQTASKHARASRAASGRRRRHSAAGRRMPRFMPRTLLVYRDVDDAAAEFVSSLSLRNACVAFHDDGHSYHRAHIVVGHGLQSPVVMHGFNERTQGYLRVTTARAAAEHEQRALGMCWRAPLGLGVPLSHPSSIYHQLFHAVPSWLYLREHVAAAGRVADAPASAFVPLAFASAALGRGKPASPRRWHAWELSVRALTHASATDITSAVTQLLRTPCTCFERFEAAARPFNLGARAHSASLRDYVRAALFNAAAVASALPPPGGRLAARTALQGGESAAAVAPLDLLFVSRRGERRTLSNEGAVWSALRSYSGRRISQRVRRVTFEGAPLTEQMAVVSSASTLIAVHGQALAWLAFLPWARRATAVVEISLATRRGVVNNCYERWCGGLGVRYWRVHGVLTGGCNGGATARDNEAQRAHKLLACNVTVDATAVLGAVLRAAEWTEEEA